MIGKTISHYKILEKLGEDKERFEKLMERVEYEWENFEDEINHPLHFIINEQKGE